jgi:hypothetical protein
MNRQGSTTKGLGKRLAELGFAKVLDPRVAGKVHINLPKILTALVVAMVTQARSLRGVERRTDQIARKNGGFAGIRKRIADNTIGTILPRLRVVCMTTCLHRLIKAEHRRGNLKPNRLSFGSIAIDGKNAGTVRWRDLCRVFMLDPQTATAAEVKFLLAQRYPEAQLCVPEEGDPYALMRMHTVTLIFSEAAPCIHIRPIEGCTNEIGSMPDVLKELKEAYGRTNLFQMVTTDAGNTSCNVCDSIKKCLQCDYFSQIKSEHGSIYKEAERALSSKIDAKAGATYEDVQKGKSVTYYAWHCDLGKSGYHKWDHVRQLIRVKRVVEDSATGEQTIGNRYYACSRSSHHLGSRTALKISRAHWRCENETHWTSDAELMEDKRRLAWSQDPRGILVVSAVRMMALAILSIARRLTHMDYSQEAPSWTQVSEHFLLILCGSTLHTAAFDGV